MRRVQPFIPFTRFIGALALVTGLGLVSTALATVDPGQLEEIWLEPAKQDANKRMGNWGVAKLQGHWAKETHFAFHVPANFDVANQENQAIIVLIPKKDDTVHYTAKINVARDGQQHTEQFGSLSNSQQVFEGEITEIDVSALIPQLMPSDYVTINLEMDRESRRKWSKTQVVGMRFQYVSTGSAQGPEGQQGPPGGDGQQGPAGPQGPSGTSGGNVRLALFSSSGEATCSVANGDPISQDVTVELSCEATASTGCGLNACVFGKELFFSCVPTQLHALTVLKETCFADTHTVECPQTSSNQGETYAHTCSSGGQVADATSCLFPAGRELVLMGEFPSGTFPIFATCTTTFGEQGIPAPTIGQTFNVCVGFQGFCEETRTVTRQVTVPVTCNSHSTLRFGTMVDNAICLGIETVP